ncbi:hypothetical protein [Herminiimonas fonticola]|uniref:hypothetical protein n=1 Tax=Herminiimonas fonticola TaxID=303380 RepID=UPI0033427C94
MTFHKNQFGVPQYPHDDARRLFVLASAIDLLEHPTATAIDDLTGIDKSTIDSEVDKLREQYGMVIHKFGETYRIASWGTILNKENVAKAMKPES